MLSTHANATAFERTVARYAAASPECDKIVFSASNIMASQPILMCGCCV